MKKQAPSTPRILIAAPKSSSGKTTVTCALLGALMARGKTVHAAKCGPDYIDPMFHRLVLGIPSGNVDSFFTEPAMTRAILKRHASGADLTVIEGAMGYFDGLGGTTLTGSAREIASVTKTPVILAVDASGAGLSLAAAIEGVLTYKGIPENEKEDVRPGRKRTLRKKPLRSVPEDLHNGIRGIILNRVSESYYPRLSALIEETCGVPVIGYLPHMPEFRVPSRHLGLISPSDMENARRWVKNLAEMAEKTIDLEAVIRIAEEAPAIPGRADTFSKTFPPAGPSVRIAAAKDEAFSFCYVENEAALKAMGAEIVPFSPIHDSALPPDIDGLILGGGYPELYIKELEKSPVRKEIRRAVSEGIPCIAECGGFLYLKESLKDGKGRSGKMAGVLPGGGYPAGKLVRFGYFEAKTLRGGLFGDRGTILKGHEFHHWDTDDNGDGMELIKPLSGKTERAAVYTESLAAGFPHYYFPGCPEAAHAFLAKCRRHQAERLSGERWDSIAHPLGGLGRLETLTQKLCGIAGSPEPYDLSKRALVVFCGDHGVVKEGVSQSGKEVTRNVAEAIAEGRSAVSYMAAEAGTDVFVVDVGVSGKRWPDTEVRTGTVISRRVVSGTGNLAKGPAMSRQQCLKAVRAGEEMAEELADQGYHLLAAGEMGIGNTTAAAACSAAMLGLSAKEAVGRGAGLDDEGMRRKMRAVEKALRRLKNSGSKETDTGVFPGHPEKSHYSCRSAERALTVLAECGGAEIAAMAGLMIGGAKRRIPVVADGVISLTAAYAAVQIDPRVREILIVSHKPVEPAGRELLRALGQKAILNGKLHLGEGTGAVLLFPLLNMAEAVYRNAPSFHERGLEAYRRFGEEAAALKKSTAHAHEDGERGTASC